MARNSELCETRDMLRNRLAFLTQANVLLQSFGGDRTIEAAVDEFGRTGRVDAASFVTAEFVRSERVTKPYGYPVLFDLGSSRLSDAQMDNDGLGQIAWRAAYLGLANRLCKVVAHASSATDLRHPGLAIASGVVSCRIRSDLHEDGCSCRLGDYGRGRAEVMLVHRTMSTTLCGDFVLEERELSRFIAR